MLLFDIDGTLLMTGGAGRVAFNHAFREMFGVDSAYRDIRPDGKTDPLIIREVAQKALERDLGPEELAAVTKRYIAHFLDQIGLSERFRLLPGVTRILDLLSARAGLLMGLATGNFKETSWAKLKRGGIDRHFRFGGFGCDAESRAGILKAAIRRGCELAEKNVSARDVWVIGDTPLDVAAGRAVGAVTVAVLSGRYTRAEDFPERPDHFVPGFADPQDFLKLPGLIG